MFELSNTLVGVYKTFDTTKTISINPNRIQELADQDEEEDKENQKRN